MTIRGVGQNYDYFGRTANATQRRTTVRETIAKAGKQPVNLSISEEGRDLLREMAGKFQPASDEISFRKMTIRNTNEVAWEHYMAMRDMSSQTLKDGNYNAGDIAKSIQDAYEARYNEIVKAHENGDREVSYELTGKGTLTLEEDLAGLDEALKMRLANLEGYMTCQRTNQAFQNPDSSWYFQRNRAGQEWKMQDPYLYLKSFLNVAGVNLTDIDKIKE